MSYGTVQQVAHVASINLQAQTILASPMTLAIQLIAISVLMKCKVQD
jgi:hypothetical protein